MAKKNRVKIFCYKLSKPVTKDLKKQEFVGKVEYEQGFIKEILGVLYLFTLEKLSKKEEIKLSNDYSFEYSGSLQESVWYTPYAVDGVSASDNVFLVMPGKSFMEKVDPENKALSAVTLDHILSLFFNEKEEEEKEVIVEHEVIEEEKEVETLVMTPEDFTTPTAETTEEEESPEEEEDLEDFKKKIKELERENYRLSCKLNNTIEEIKNISFWEIIFWKWKKKLLDILEM